MNLGLNMHIMIFISITYHKNNFSSQYSLYQYDKSFMSIIGAS